MIIESFGAFAATVLGVSLATERLVVFAKAAFPRWLAEEKKTDAAEVDLIADRGRRVRVHLVAFVAALIASASLAEQRFDLLGEVPLGAGGAALPVPLLALLSMAGSAFWTNLVGYASAAKDIRMQERSSLGLDFQAKAREYGRVPADSGIAAATRGASPGAAELATVMDRMTTISQPAFDVPESRVVSHG